MRNIRFTFLCNAEERRQLRMLSNYLSRSQSDTVRFLISRAMKDFRSDLAVHLAEEENVGACKVCGSFHRS